MLRLHAGLRELEVDSHVLVQLKEGTDATVHRSGGPLGGLTGRARFRLDALPSKVYRHRRAGLFSSAWLPERISARVDDLGADVVNLHWVTGGFLSAATLGSLKRPVVWTLHDSWAFTGG